jgi:hypothetical protein
MSALTGITWARDQVGTVETSPNWGGKISVWIRASGYTFPVAWCQCFANAVAVQGGAPQPTPFPAKPAGFTPAFLLGQFDGQGYDPIPLSQAEPGDFVYFDWSMGRGDPCDHVGVLLSMTATTVTCVEGNTSSTNAGSQNNGGGVWIKTRSRSLVAGAVSVPYKSRSSAPYRSIDFGDSGSDVRAFQIAVNKRADGCGRADRRTIVDGEVGSQTLENGAWAAYILGIGDTQASNRSGGISPYVQRLVRDPDERNQTQIDRAPERRRQAGCT